MRAFLFGDYMNFKIDCDREDCTIQVSEGITTLVYYQPIYNKHGENINPDLNRSSGGANCRTCGKIWNYQTINNVTTMTERE